MNGIKIFQTLSAQKSKKNEDNNHSIVVSSILKKYLEYYNNSNNNTTGKTIIKTLFFSGGIIRLVFIKTEYVQRITINNILSSNLTMWDLSLCPRTLQDQEFNGEQNDELCSFHSRTSSHKKPSKWISCQEYQKEKVHLISYGTYYEKERQKGFDNGLKKKTSEETKLKCLCKSTILA